MKWGEIPRGDLEMKSYAPDTSAHAVILADFGESRINGDLGVTFNLHRRIKIFGPAGYEWGTHVISLYTKKHWSRLQDIKGATYSLGPDGSVQKTELDDDMIFRENVDQEYTRYRFTMPALQPGCVIEFRYTIEYKSWFLMPTWYFQHSIPTLWSEYRTLAPSTLAYAKATFSYEPFYIQESTTCDVHIGGGNYFTNGALIRCEASRWVMRNLAGLREEPFITTVDDYKSQVRLQLAEYAGPSGGVNKVLKSWDKLIEELIDDRGFGELLDAGSAVRDLTQRVLAGKDSEVEKMTAIYDYVRSTVVWNGKHTVFASDLDDILKTRKGDGGDINLLQMAMLRSAGLTVDPVIASTRSHGLVSDMYPLIEQFNTVVARVNAGGSVYFLDATDPLRPVNLVSPALLNVTGLVVKKGVIEWVKITSSQRFRHRSLALLSLEASGVVRGTLESSDEEYSALLKRRDAREKKPMDIAAGVFASERLGFTLDSTIVYGLDSTAGPMRIKAFGSASSYAQAAGDHIYVNPVILDRLTESPFKLKKRKFPIDMSYGRNVVFFSQIRIPPGFEILETPKNLELGGNEYRFTRRTAVQGDSIQTIIQLSFAVSIIPSGRYEDLCEFYNRIVSAESEQIVLQRKALPTVQPQQPAGRKKGRTSSSSSMTRILPMFLGGMKGRL